MKRNSLDLTAICFAWILLWALLKSPKRFLTDVCVCVFQCIAGWWFGTIEFYVPYKVGPPSYKLVYKPH